MADDLVPAALIRLEAGLGCLRTDIEASQTSPRAEITSLRVDVMARIDEIASHPL